MQRAKRILTHGWWRITLNVLTHGYYPAGGIAVGKLCVDSIAMMIPSATLALSIPGSALAMSIPGAAVTMAIPGVTLALSVLQAPIEMEDCT